MGIRRNGKVVRVSDLDLLLRIKYVEPGPKAQELIKKYAGKRSFAKSYLKKENGLCAWCEIKEVPQARKKYCSKDCNESADLNCYPQHHSSKGWFLIERQQFACARCGVSFEDQILDLIRKAFDRAMDYAKRGWSRTPKHVHYWQIFDNTGDIWQVDHIIPVHKGGAGCGVENVQVLCVQCHKDKTREDYKS